MSRTAVKRTSVALWVSLLLVSFAVCSYGAQAEKIEVDIITCEGFIRPKKMGEPYIPVGPTRIFSPTAAEENVHVVIRFATLNQDTTLKIIVTRDSPDGQYVDSRHLSVSATDVTAGAGMTIPQTGKYFIKVVNPTESEVYGADTFIIGDGKAKYSDHMIEFVPFALIALLLITLSIAEWFNFSWLIHLKRWYKKPILLATTITILVLSIALFFEGREYNLLQHSNVIGILGIIGIIGTIIGVFLTYEQLKLAEDRIENYEKFYDVLNEVLNDSKARSLQFFGSTILPGQVAYGDKDLLLRYVTGLEKTTYRIRMGEIKGDVSIIVPSEARYRDAYNPYIGKTYRKRKYDENQIKAMIEDALIVQNSIKQKSNLIEITREEEIGIIDAFYFSNGRTVVYAVPLHYNLARAEVMENAEQESQGEPVLIGFKTTNRTIVKAFEQHFEDLRSKFSSRMLRVDEFRDPTNLAVKLRDAQDPLSQYLHGQFSQELQQQLDEYHSTTPPSKSLQIALVHGLNQLLKGPILFDEQLRMQVILTQEIRNLIEQNPQGEDLIRLNRLLLEAAYPQEIAKSPRI